MVRGVVSSADRKSKQSIGKNQRAADSNRSHSPHAHQRQASRVGSAMRWLTWGLTFMSVITVSAGLGATIALMAPFRFGSGDAQNQPLAIGDLFRRGFQYGISRPINILVLGVDLNPEAEKGTAEIFKSRSDTMLLVRLNPDSDQVNLLSIPRDTRVEIPDVGVTKINAANYWGGAELAAEVVSRTLNDVPIDRYVRISTEAFRELVDVVGGVEVFVPEPMQYEDQTQGLKIDLKPGLQTLNADQAEGFIRFRNHNLGDIGRSQRQQILLKALQKRFANPMVLARLPQVLSVLQKHIDTDLSMGEMLALMQFGLQLKSDQLQMSLLPGRFSAPDEYEYSFWIMDWKGIDRVMQTYFDVLPPVGYDLPASDPEADYALSISVQNASGDSEGGHKMVDYLYSQGFYNVYLDDDWPQALAKTHVIPQWGELSAAQRLQGAMSRSQLTVNATGDLRSDLTVRVGRDWLDSQQAKALNRE